MTISKVILSPLTQIARLGISNFSMLVDNRTFASAVVTSKNRL